MNDNSEAVPPSAPPSEDEKFFFRVEGKNYPRKNFKLPAHVPFRSLRKTIGLDCTLRYKGKNINLDLTPPELGMKRGQSGACLLEVVLASEVREADAAAATAAAADTAAAPSAAAGAQSAPAVAATPPRSLPLPPSTRPPPKWAATPGAAKTTEPSDDSPPSYSAPAPPPPLAATPVAQREPAPQQTLPAPQSTSAAQPSTPRAQSNPPHASPSELRQLYPPPPSSSHSRSAASTNAVQPAVRTAPPAPQPISYPAHAQVPASTLGGPGRVGSQRQPKAHHELRMELRPAAAAGLPSHALDRHQRDGGSPPRAAMSHGAPAASRHMAAETSSLVMATPHHFDAYSYNGAAAAAPSSNRRDDSALGPAASTSGAPPPHWSQFYTFRPPQAAPEPAAIVPSRTAVGMAPTSANARSPPREGVVVGYHRDYAAAAASSRGPAPTATGVVVDAVPHHHSSAAHHAYAAYEHSAQHIRSASPPPPPPPPPPPQPQAPSIPFEEFFTLKREAGRLKDQVEALQDALADERAHREVLENQVRQLASVVLAQMEEQKSAAAEDYATKEHQRQMQALREQRKQQASASSLPRSD